MIPTYLINLGRSTDRLRSMQEQLERLDIPFERIAAVDGTNLEPSSVAFQVGNAIPTCGRSLTDGEIGCSMSHLIAYKKIVEAGHPFALILEDDLWLPPHTRSLVEELIEWNRPQKWDIVLLHHMNSSFRKFSSTKVNRRIRLIQFKRSAASAAGYIVSLETAQRLLSLGQPIRMPADKLTGDKSVNKMKICGILCSPFTNSGFPTTIQSRPE
ncbi:MAG TPA: hypothetical protein DCX06_13305 [Opitutae bacterium]|nr:hypothetical protein [Opitutae bacterium]